MSRFLELVWARNKEFYRDKGVLAWAFLFPFLVIVGFSFAFARDSQDFFKVAIHSSGATPQSLAEFRATHHIQWIDSPQIDESLSKLRRHAIDLVLDSSTIPPRYWINETSPKGYLLERILRGSTPSGAAPQTQPQREVVNGKEIRYVDWLIAGLLAMNMMFSSLFGVGYTLVRYRKNGVLKRLKATPLSAFEFLSAQMVSRFLIIGISSAVVYAGCHWLVHFTMLGSYADLAVVLGAGAFCLISLGLLVAARISSEELAGGVLNVLTWPMIFLSGVWFSLEGAAPWVKKLALVFPLTHVIDSARAIMTEGAPLAAVFPHVAALLAMGVAFLTLGSLFFSWD